MHENGCDAVTGAFGYSGQYIARQLLKRGRRVITLTNRQASDPELGRRISAFPFCFDDPALLADRLRGVDTLYNTYWVRFSHGRASFDTAVLRTKTLFDAAGRAGVRRIVHISITNPSLESSLPYFRGKAVLEHALMTSGMSYAIVRPTVVFGVEDILINNIAWLLRRVPVFVIPGSGAYRLQPVFVEDLAALAVEAGAGSRNVVLNAVGPDIFTFDELVGLIRQHVGGTARIVHAPPGLALLLARMIGFVLRDVILTRDEADGLMADLLVSADPPTGRTRFADWLRVHAAALGVEYASELARHYRSSR